MWIASTILQKATGENMQEIPLNRYWNLLVAYLRPQRLRVGILALLIAASIGIQLVSPQFLRIFIDSIVAGATASHPDAARNLTVAALAYLAMAVAIQLVSVGTTYLGETVAWTATNALRRDLALHCLRLDMSYHKAHTPGELVERIDGDVNTLANFFSQLAIRLLSNGLLAIGILAVVSTEDWRAGLVSAGYIAGTALALRGVQRSSAAAWHASRQVESELYGYVGERLGATEEIRANGAETYVLSGLHRLARRILQAWRKAKMVQGLSQALEAVVYLLALVAILAISGAQYLRNGMTIGTIYLLVAYAARLRGPLIQIRHQVDNLQQAGASIARVEGLLHEQPSVIETPRVGLPSGALHVAFDDVTFRYHDVAGDDGHEAVLRDISFDLAPQRVLGLLGRTGSGKTTLTRLLFRLYDPVQGTIRLGDIDLRDLGLSELRGRVGLVTQDVQLFQGTVRDNVRLFSNRVPDAQIVDAFRELGLVEWYRALSHGLDTQLKAAGQNLSAGEAQLLAFARIFLKDPGLVVLDEASSRLDPATERLLENAIDRLLRGRTAIVIAHRLATVERADEIMVLEEGRLVEHGPREILVHDPGSRFHHLLRAGLQEVLA
jgi:ABC-type multidrug transport system fused ATPase/permease subunit